jgi:hypothetical protein
MLLPARRRWAPQRSSCRLCNVQQTRTLSSGAQWFLHAAMQDATPCGVLRCHFLICRRVMCRWSALHCHSPPVATALRASVAARLPPCTLAAARHILQSVSRELPPAQLVVPRCGQQRRLRLLLPCRAAACCLLNCLRCSADSCSTTGCLLPGIHLPCDQAGDSLLCVQMPAAAQH